MGEQLAVLRRIRLADPRQHELIEAMEQLRTSCLGRLPGEPTRALSIIQPSGAGKSEAAKQFKRFVESQPGRDPALKPVVHVTLDTTGTPRSLFASCLAKIGDPFADKGTEAVLHRRLREMLARFGVEMLIIDELNHCSEKVLGRDVSNSLKNMLTDGVVPIVLLGTSKAQRLFKDNPELRNRCRPHLSLAPIDVEKDLPLWSAFLAGMDREMVRAGVMTTSSELDAPTTASALCVACSGLIGELAAVLEDAAEIVLKRSGSRIDPDDLRAVIDRRYVLDGHLDENPFGGRP